MTYEDLKTRWLTLQARGVPYLVATVAAVIVLAVWLLALG